MKLLINTDGASRGNPGHSAYGFIIKDESGTVLHQEGGYMGIATNNVAEYTAILKALQYIKNQFSNKSLTLDCYADSKLLIEQLSGRFKVKNHTLKRFFEQIKLLELSLGVVFYRHIPREQNFLADKLANQALDQISPS